MTMCGSGASNSLLLGELAHPALEGRELIRQAAA
jgi:hypothetical protein